MIYCLLERTEMLQILIVNMSATGKTLFFVVRLMKHVLTVINLKAHCVIFTTI